MGENDQKNQDHHANQLNLNNTNLNHNNDDYKAATDNHANQLNPNSSK